MIMIWVIFRRALWVVISSYTAIVATVWLRQERLMFKPDPFSRLGQTFRAVRNGRGLGRTVHEWHHTADDGITIQGFISKPKGREMEHLPTIMYFGGIREESSWVMSMAHHFSDCTLVCLNYRGYGMSQGAPAQQSILNDCVGAIEMLHREGRIDKNLMMFIGRSLGSGVVGYLSNVYKPLGVCLITPYDSVMAVAKKMYWWMPVKWMFRHPFEAVPWAQQNNAPMLMVLSEVDETVPHENSAKLFEAWAGAKQMEKLSGCNHSSIINHPDLFPLISKRLFPLLQSAHRDRGSK